MDMISIRRKLMVKQSEDTPTDLLANVEWIEGYFIASNGAIIANETAKYCDFAQVLPNTTYILQGHINNTNLYDRLHAYSADQTWIRQIAQFDWVTQDFTSTFTTPEGCRYIRLSTEITTEVHMYLA